MRGLWLCSVLCVALLTATPAGAWVRGTVEPFAILPAFSPHDGACPNGKASCVSDVEGVAVAPDGTIYAPSFGVNKDGALTGNGEVFVISPTGKVLRHFPVPGSSPHLIGGIFQPSSQQLLIPDLELGVVWQVDPTGASSVFMKAPTVTTAPGLNAMAFDKAGNVYVSDSFQGAIWMTGPNGGTPTAWYAPFNKGQSNLLLPTANKGQLLVPPFGANGITFNNKGTALFVNNTAYHSIIKIPVNPDGSAGTATTFTTGINAPDGVALDRNDNLWVLANQGDEVVVVDPTGKVIQKLGDFDGIAANGSINGLLFPASDTFSPDGQFLYVTNLALYLPYAGVASIAVDSGWTLQVKHFNVARIAVCGISPAIVC
jgi:SMP-30/Gluconolactonase/LRE-like region